MCFNIKVLNDPTKMSPDTKIHRDHGMVYQKGEGLNMCFIFKLWLPKYRIEIALGVGNTNLNSKIKE